ncbi:MAG: GMC family oxidoreductase [Deltaproteobacteria bacterium]|nr:GMC family oxidoreductase [Deltaproteobacteria bacterium]
MTGEIHNGRSVAGDLDLSTDVVIVGSGASGAVVAAELAEAGQKVVVLEEGGHHLPAAMGAMRPSESLRHVWRAGSMTAAIGIGDSPVINVMMGRAVGGSSLLTGGVCFRIPEHKLVHWSTTLGLTELTPAKLEPYFDAVERAIHVETVPETARSRSTVLYEDGARKLGYRLTPLRRNTRGCEGRSKCNFVCPHQAKASVDLTYLPRAVAAGAEIYADCRVSRVVPHGGRAVGVSGRLLDADGHKRGHLMVRARRVVLAASAWYTPLLLWNSGIGRGSGVVGRNMTLHPSLRVIGEFDEEVRGWHGALQSAYSDAFLAERLTLVSAFVPTSILAATMPGAGPAFMARADRIRHLGVFGGMIHDEGGGRLHRGLGREPWVTYRMARADRAALSRLIRILADTWFAAGARRVYLPVFGLEGLDPSALATLNLDRIPASRIECTSQHPLGTCRMGTDRAHSVVNQDGETWDLPGLYIVDGSTFPTSLGVNPQLGIMAMAARAALRMLDRPLPAAV